MPKLKIAFFGTPELTTVILDSLVKHDLTPALIVTTPDKPQGRKLILTPPPAKIWALEKNIPLLQPEKIDTDFIQKLSEEKFDLFVVVAYGKILPETLINLPTYGTINVHYSLLPKYRGATPVESAILNGDKETGVCIQKMQFKLDTGPILALESFTLTPTITTPVLRDALNHRASEMLPKTILQFTTGKIIPIPQDDSLATHCKKIEKEDGLIDPDGDPVENDRKFRAYVGWPGAYFFVEKNGTRIRVKVTDAELSGNTFVIKRVIPEGKKEILFVDFERGL